jgi:hypothetical protein
MLEPTWVLVVGMVVSIMALGGLLFTIREFKRFDRDTARQVRREELLDWKRQRDWDVAHGREAANQP